MLAMVSNDVLMLVYKDVLRYLVSDTAFEIIILYILLAMMPKGVVVAIQEPEFG